MNNFQGQCDLDIGGGPFGPTAAAVAAPIAVESVEPQEIMDVDSVTTGAMENNNGSDNDNNEMVVECEMTEALSNKVFENEMVRI